MRKTFIFNAKGKTFNLETFVTEDKTFLTQQNDVEFKSKAEFIECINHCITKFYENVATRLEEGTPECTVTYRGHSADIGYIDINGGNSYSINTQRLRVREIIFELVRDTERQLGQIMTRATSFSDDFRKDNAVRDFRTEMIEVN